MPFILAVALIGAIWYFIGGWWALGITAALAVIAVGWRWLALLLVGVWFAWDHISRRRRQRAFQRRSDSKSASSGSKGY